MPEIIISIDGQCFFEGAGVKRRFEMNAGNCGTFCYVAEGGCGACTLHCNNNGLFATGGNVFAVKWRHDLYELRCAATAERDCEVAAEGYRLTVHRGPHPNVRVYAGSCTHTFETAVNVTCPTASLITNQHEPILQLKGGAPCGDYLMMIALGDAPKVLLEAFGEVETQGNEISVETPLFDMRGHVLTKKYRWDGKKFTKYYDMLKCTNEHMYIQELYGYLLLEAVLCEDKTDTLGLVTPEIADYDALKNYFGDFAEVDAPPFATGASTAATLTKTDAGYTATLYDFEFENGKICNITKAEGKTDVNLQP